MSMLFVTNVYVITAKSIMRWINILFAICLLNVRLNKLQSEYKKIIC